MWAWLISFRSTRDFQGISYCFVPLFNLVKVSWFGVCCYLRQKQQHYSTSPIQVSFLHRFLHYYLCSLSTAVKRAKSPASVPYYCIPCHRLPLRSLHWPSCDQKGILYIHPIICLRRIPGPARLVGLSLFFLLILTLFVIALFLLCPSYGTFCRLVVR